MRVFSVDLETHSPAKLPSIGAVAYFTDPRTRVIMAAYHPVGDPSPPRLWLAGQPPPTELVAHVLAGGKLCGWNVIGFDRLGWNTRLVPQHGFPPISDDAWLDSMHLAAAANLPRSLDGCARSVGVGFEANLKDNNRLRKITDANRTPDPTQEDIQWLASRCVQDVTMEEATLMRLPAWPTMKPWDRMPAIDRRINDRGVLMDVELVQGLAKAAAIETARLDKEMHKLTNGQVPATTTVEALKTWLMSSGVELPLKETKEDPEDQSGDDEEEKDDIAYRLRKSDIADLLARDDVPEHCRLALEWRAEAAKASVKKLRRMMASAGPDGRLRGALILGGAQQTLRFSGAAWQPHNMLRDVIGNPDEVAEQNGLDVKKDKAALSRLCRMVLATAIQVGRTGDPDLIASTFTMTRKDLQGRTRVEGVLPFVSRMSRLTLAAPKGRLLLNGDFSQIEARLTAWASGQQNIVDAFAKGEDVYKVAAAGIYRVPIETITKQMRQIGKVSVLALGFGGGVGAFPAMAMNYGVRVSREEAAPIVKAWREANIHTKKFWYAVSHAAVDAVMNPGREFWVAPLGMIAYKMEGGALCARLPSGRLLRYWAPRLDKGYWPDGSEKDWPDLSSLTVKGRAVFRRGLYHTILVENLIQAMAADLLANGLVNMEDAGLPVVMHVHDSIADEVDEDQAETLLPMFKECMLAAPAWAQGLPVAADVHISARFG